MIATLYDAALVSNVRNRPNANTPIKLIDLLCVWYRRHNQRWQLRALADDPDFLHDIGRSRQEVMRESRKPFWQP